MWLMSLFVCSLANMRRLLDISETEKFPFFTSAYSAIHFQNVASRCINLGMLFLQGQYRVLFDIIHAYNEETWIPEGNGTEPLRQYSLQGSRIFSWHILCKSKFPENWIKFNKPLQKMSDISVCTEGFYK